MWRKIVGGVILIVTILALFMIWMVGQTPADEFGEPVGLRGAEAQASKTMGIGIMVCIWSILMVPLGILFAALRKSPKQDVSLHFGDYSTSSLCPHCGKWYVGSPRYCPQCGQKLEPPK